MTTVDPDEAETIVRPASRADLLDVTVLENRCFPHPWPYTAFERHLDAPAFLVAINGERIVGHVVGDVRDDFFGPLGHIKDLAVDPAMRRRGIGRRLLAAALRLLAGNGVERTTLEVRESNEPAIALYRSFGFERQRIHPGYYEDGEDAIVMIRNARQIGMR